MEKQLNIINDKYFNVIHTALKDKNINANSFKLLVYIIINPNNVSGHSIKKDIHIKNNNTISNCINILLKNKYITRERKKTLIIKNTGFYDYIINTNKSILPNNSNSPYFEANNYFKKIEELFNFFFGTIKNNQKISVVTNKKACELLLFNDDYELEYLKALINYMNENNSKYKIFRITSFRKKISIVIDDYNSHSMLKRCKSNKPKQKEKK